MRTAECDGDDSRMSIQLIDIEWLRLWPLSFIECVIGDVANLFTWINSKKWYGPRLLIKLVILRQKETISRIHRQSGIKQFHSSRWRADRTLAMYINRNKFRVGDFLVLTCVICSQHAWAFTYENYRIHYKWIITNVSHRLFALDIVSLARSRLTYPYLLYECDAERRHMGHQITGCEHWFSIKCVYECQTNELSHIHLLIRIVLSISTKSTIN